MDADLPVGAEGASEPGPGDALDTILAQHRVFQERARAWVGTPDFQKVYEDLHPGFLAKCLILLLGKRKNWATRSPGLRARYERLAREGELIFARLVIGNSGIGGNPALRLPACLLAAFPQDAASVRQVIQLGEELGDAYFLGGSETMPRSARLMADDDYRPFRCRPLPAEETAGVEMALFDVRVSADELFGGPRSVQLVPLLVQPDRSHFMVVPWPVLHGRPFPLPIAGPPPLPAGPGLPPPLPKAPPPLPGAGRGA